jgi:hypothetical protein
MVERTLLMATIGKVGPLGSGTATSRTAKQRRDHIRQERIPTGQRCERLRLRSARVAALTLEHQHVLAEVIGQLDDVEWWPRRHHRAICRERRVEAFIQC